MNSVATAIENFVEVIAAKLHIDIRNLKTLDPRLQTLDDHCPR